MMKRLSLFVLATLTAAGALTMPVKAQTCEAFQYGCVIKGSCVNIEDILKQLPNCCPSLSVKCTDVPNTGCLPKTPDIPETPDAPKTPDVPEIPDAPKTEEDDTDTSYADQIVALVNQERAKNGLAPLTLDRSIGAAALTRAKEIEISFSHTRPDGSSFSTVLSQAGISYRGAGENIAWGQRSPEEVMNGWMNSSGHRANILNSSFTKIGVGYYQNANGTNYWVQLFTY